ncbi:MAG TPA: RsmB/NOP family class I SAM-dependent RNA methyltransferase, partial [Caulobacterales bacterium]|nr:RsmB/NOP family class I SAM-dependent RNA methyltransferase [Caulobacterales bacterium]
APLVKSGGRLLYVTCSVLPEENTDALATFMHAHAEFAPAPLEGADRLPAHAHGRAVQLTPATTGCDGFFIAALTRA